MQFDMFAAEAPPAAPEAPPAPPKARPKVAPTPAAPQADTAVPVLRPHVGALRARPEGWIETVVTVDQVVAARAAHPGATDTYVTLKLLEAAGVLLCRPVDDPQLRDIWQHVASPSFQRRSWGAFWGPDEARYAFVVQQSPNAYCDLRIHQ